MAQLVDRIAQRIAELQAQKLETQARADKDKAEVDVQIGVLSNALGVLAKTTEAEAVMLALLQYKLIPRD